MLSGRCRTYSQKDFCQNQVDNATAQTLTTITTIGFGLDFGFTDFIVDSDGDGAW